MKKIYLLLTFLFLNIFSQNAFSQKKDVLYEKLDLFGDILETINKEYFKQINEGEVIDGAINGMLQSLDPYSSYMSPKTFKSMNTETKGEFGGLGIEVTMEAGLVKVISPIDDTPADRAGIRSGDYIIKLDKKQVKGLTLDEAVNTMRGKSGTPITLTIRRIDVDEPIIVKIVRETINKEYFKQINEGEVIDGAINGMLQSLDPYSSYMSPKTFKSMNTETKGEFGGLGIEVTMEAGLVKVISPIDDTPADRAGIKSGDYIIKLDNKQVKGLTLDEAVNTMRGKSGTPITLTIRRIDVDEPIIVKIVRETIKTKSVVSEIKENIGYLRLRSFNEKSGDELIDKIREIGRSKPSLTGYILDLRNNPGGLLSQAIKISDAFLDSGEIVSTKGRDPKDIKVYNSKKGDEINGKPLIVLINKGSASASEIVAGALKDHKRAIVIGEKSFGKGSVQSIMPLSNGGGLRLTTAKYYLPSGETIEEIGVQPDIKVEPQKDNFKINDPINDNQLIYALKLLKAS